LVYIFNVRVRGAKRCADYNTVSKSRPCFSGAVRFPQFDVTILNVYQKGKTQSPGACQYHEKGFEQLESIQPQHATHIVMDSYLDGPTERSRAFMQERIPGEKQCSQKGKTGSRYNPCRSRKRNHMANCPDQCVIKRLNLIDG
jgi:hypothetical protein